MKKVLIVDDEYYFRQAVKKYISKYKDEFEVCGEANNGKTGFNLLLELSPDIALVDITMPQMDGISLIEKARQENILTKIIILTGYSEFEYAQKAVRMGVQDYLLKPIESENLYKCLKDVSSKIDQENAKALQFNKLTDSRHKIEALLKEHLAQKLIKNDLDMADIRTMAENLNFDLTKDYYVALLFNIQIDHQMSWNEEDLYLCHFSVSNILTELFGENVECAACTNDSNSLCIVIGMEYEQSENYSDYMHEILTQFLEIVEQYLEFSVLISVGTPYRLIEQIYLSYQEALSVEKYRLLHGEKGICFYTDCPSLEIKKDIVTDEYRRKLILLMRQNNIEEIGKMIKDALKKMKLYNLHPDMIYMQANDMISAAVEFASEYGIELTGTDRDVHFFSDIIAIKSMSKLQEYTLSVIIQILQQAHGQNDEVRNLTSEKIRIYIEENYHNPDLKLETIANHFYINVQHMCFIFKRHMNTTVGDYILKVRMTEAKKMFNESSFNISLVAKKCGYEDANYFGKCFKKYYGISPKRYVESKEQ